ncbi:MAG: Hsp20 family protein [Xanthomonadales bacterium]|nr:Hsp20 family protein [Xanthomonadales bacterium]
MTTFDFSPLFRNTIGFDRMAQMLDHSTRTENGTSYPPYNIETRGENHYRITMAVAGFSQGEVDIEFEKNTLTVSGRKAEENTEPSSEYLYQGIANRAFKRAFKLADHIKVSDASMENGLLHINLELEIPEEMKPRKISISGNARLLDTGASEVKAA